MSSLNPVAEQMIEQLAGEVPGLDTTDLPALADMHGRLQELGSLLGKAEAEHERSNAVRRAEQLLEKIILREADDAGKALEEIARLLAEVAAITRGGSAQPTQPSIPDVAPGTAGQSSAEVAPCPTPDPEAKQCKLPPGPHEFLVISPDDAPLVIEFIGEARGHIEAAEASILAVEEHPDDLEAVNAIFRAFHTIKGVAGFLNLKEIGSLAHAAENLLDLGRKGKLQLVGPTVDVILESIDLMKALIAGLEESVKCSSPVLPNPKIPELLENLEACASGRPSASSPSRSTCASPSEPARSPADSPARAASTAGASSGASSGAASSGDASVKVSTERLDSLINMVGELVIAESMVRQDISSLAGGDQRLARNVSHLAKITRALQGLSMSMRMVPIQGVFQKMSRLVRDLTRKACKEIDLSITGGETELDRNVVEAIGDPLVHMVRNAVDHGIEPPEERERNGKPRSGRVELKACHQGGNIVIQIRDDGRGLNKKKILRKAIDHGLVREGQELGDPEIFNLIFAPGLSTADKITDVSGRGVGMDVVKRNIEALRGRVEIASTEGAGSTFTIRLPLTLAVIDGLVVKIGASRYILPLTSIEQSVRPQAGQLSTVQGRGEMFLARGDLLPMFRLYRMLGVEPRFEDPTQALVVIVHDNQRRCCLMVDELLGQQQVVIKSLGDGIGKVNGISGGAILGDGNVSLILDVPGLIDSAMERNSR